MAHTLETRRFKDTATARSQRANPPPGQTRARMQGQAIVGGRDRAHIRAVAPATAGKLHEAHGDAGAGRIEREASIPVNLTGRRSRDTARLDTDRPRRAGAGVATPHAGKPSSRYQHRLLRAFSLLGVVRRQFADRQEPQSGMASSASRPRTRASQKRLPPRAGEGLSDGNPQLRQDVPHVQRARQQADYALDSSTFYKSDVLVDIASAESAIEQFQQVDVDTRREFAAQVLFRERATQSATGGPR